MVLLDASAIAISKDDRGFEVAVTAWTVGNIVDGESWLSKDSLLLNMGAADFCGWWFCIDAMSARVSILCVEELRLEERSALGGVAT
jgi:hypothetical protein